MTRWIFLLLIILPVASAAEDFEFRIPSYISLQTAGSSEDSRNVALQAAFTLPANWQLGLSGDRGEIPDSETGDKLKQSGYGAWLASDPLALLSFTIGADTWKMEDQVKARGVDVALTGAWRAWTLTLEAAQETITFLELPRLIWSSHESDVQHRRWGATVEYYGFKNFTFKIHYAQHDYDQDLTDYTEGLRVLFISPSVLTTATGFVSSEGYLYGGYSWAKWSAGLKLGAIESALDAVRSSYTGVTATWRFHRRWSANSGVTFYQPQSTDEDSDRLISSTVGFSYNW